MKIFLAFPEFELPEIHVREALVWFAEQVMSRRRTRAMHLLQQARQSGVSDYDRLADKVSTALLGSFAIADPLGINDDAARDMFMVGALGIDSISAERFLEIASMLDQPPGDMLLQSLKEGLESAISDGTSHQSPVFGTDPQGAMRHLLERYDWIELLNARNLMFAFGRRLAVFQFLRWMKKPNLRTDIFWDGLISQNHFFRTAALLHPGEVRKLLRPSLSGGFASFKELLMSPAVSEEYMIHFIEAFDKMYNDVLPQVIRGVDTPEFLRSMQKRFSTVDRL